MTEPVSAPAPVIVRRIDALLDDLMRDEPVIAVHGSRSYTYEGRLHVMPVDCLWRPAA
ncbi:MAG: hypothetical protein LBQ06_05115 [Frankiaceae bacterium]|jgi:hypothetical protein|nr:hypothetical protein [Frankiaceae bacterium]